MAISTTEYMNRYGHYPGSGAGRRPRPAAMPARPVMQPGQAFGLSDASAAFAAWADDLEEGVLEAVRPAAQAGAEVLYSAVLANVARLGTVTGNLERSVYQAYVDKESGPGHARYDVSWNHRKAPHGHLLEYGFIQKFKVYLGRDGKWYTNKDAPLPAPVQRPAKAFVRSAAARIPQAEAAMEAKFFEVVGGAL